MALQGARRPTHHKSNDCYKPDPRSRINRQISYPQYTRPKNKPTKVPVQISPSFFPIRYPSNEQPSIPPMIFHADPNKNRKDFGF